MQNLNKTCRRSKEEKMAAKPHLAHGTCLCLRSRLCISKQALVYCKFSIYLSPFGVKIVYYEHSEVEVIV